MSDPLCSLLYRSLQAPCRCRDTAIFSDRLSLLTPVVKAWITDRAIECASTGIQVHGGLGYIEDTGAAQHLRDARIMAIYEGTNGIQANDLIGRKILRESGSSMLKLISDMRDDLLAQRC